jgi:hypothetical protein
MGLIDEIKAKIGAPMMFNITEGVAVKAHDRIGCPVHGGEDRNFSIHEDYFRCWSKCACGWDVIDWYSLRKRGHRLSEIDKESQREVISELCHFAGISPLGAKKERVYVLCESDRKRMGWFIESARAGLANDVCAQDKIKIGWALDPRVSEIAIVIAMLNGNNPGRPVEMVPEHIRSFIASRSETSVEFIRSALQEGEEELDRMLKEPKAKDVGSEILRLSREVAELSARFYSSTAAKR